jgi:carboxyl-terminal processing protease
MTKTQKKIIVSIVSVITAVLVFLAGFFIGRTNNDLGSTYSWIWRTVNKYYYQEMTEQEFLAKYNAGGITYALDIYSAYYTPTQYAATQASNSGSKSGVGLSYSYVTNHPDGDGVLLTEVAGNSPAFHAGLRRGMILTSGIFDGQTVTFTSSTTLSAMINAQDTGEDFTLITNDGEQYTMAKSNYTASYTYMATNSSSWQYQSAASGGLAMVEDVDGKISYLPDDYAYLRLSQFYGTAAAEMGYMIAKFNALNCKTLILDLRNNGGGQVSTMQNISYYFTSNIEGASASAMYAKYRNGQYESFNITKQSTGEALATGTQVYVLANNGTASASEALIGVLVSCGLVDYSHIYLSNFDDGYVNWYVNVAGISASSFKNGRTYGKGIMQTTIPNTSTGEALKLTTAEIFWPDKVTSIHNVGLTASNGCKLVNAAWSVTKNDEELQSVISAITA